MDITPVAWQRPKTRVANGFVKHYSPNKTKEYEDKVAALYKQSTDVKFDTGQALVVTIILCMPIPASTTKKRKRYMLDGLIRHTKRPDVDNLGKAVIDALNGVAWDDDSQITHLHVEKKYSDHPCVWLHIREDVF